MSGANENTQLVRTFCRICPVGCGMLVHVDAGRIVRIRGDKDHPLSAGYLCSKGLAAGQAHHSPRRLDRPLINRNEALHPLGWDAAMDDIGDKLTRIRSESGPNAIGIYFGTAGFFDTGSTMLCRQLAAALETNSFYTATSVDAPGYQLVAERMSGNPLLMPQPAADAGLVILIGINPIVSHGHNFYMPSPKARLREWAQRGGLWVIDPRLSESAEMANGHLRPLPGTEYALLGFLIRSLLLEGGADTSFLENVCSNVGKLVQSVASFDLELTAAITEVAPTELLRLLSDIRRVGRIALHTGTGVSMSRNANVTTWLGWALNAVTGSMDRPGGIWFNRGMMRDWVQVGWQPANTSEPGPRSRPDLPRRVGQMPSGAMADEIETGNLRALIVVGGNPLIAFPESDRLRAALRKLDLLIVLDVVPTGTTALATHVLPCTGQFERADVSIVEKLYPKEFTQYTPRTVPPAGERRPAWWILGEIGRRLGVDLAPADTHADEATLFKPMISAPRFDPAQFQGDTARHIVSDEYSFGWIEKHLPGKRWNLAPDELVAQLQSTVAPRRRAGYVLLIPSRQRHKINSTMNDGIADRHDDSLPGIYVSEADAERYSLQSGALTEVVSETGKLIAPVRIDPRMREGCISVPHGFESANVGQLTSSRRHADPLSGMIEQSGVEVRIRAC